MRKISADFIFPVSSSPITNGVVITDDSGKILSVDERKNFEDAELEIHQGIVCPGFINAHCHLELSYMKDKIPEKKGMVQFIIDLIDYRNGFLLSENENTQEIIYNAIRNAEEEMLKNGIVAAGDISNDHYTFDFKAQNHLKYHTFVECFGFVREKAEGYFNQSLKVFQRGKEKNLSVSVTPHAPYSVSPELFGLIFSFHDESDPTVFSFHNQESEAENEFFHNGSGDFLRLFKHFNLPLSLSYPPGKNSLQSVLPFFPKDKKMLLVHNTFSSAADLHFANKQFHTSRLTPHTSQLYFCTCPNANLYIENKLPDYSHWKNYPNQVCIGTDSLASNHQLSILEEMKVIQFYDSSINTEQLIQWGTLNGAKFFGWDELGSLEPGKTPGVNLISSIAERTLSLLPETQVQPLI